MLVGDGVVGQGQRAAGEGPIGVADERVRPRQARQLPFDCTEHEDLLQRLAGGEGQRAALHAVTDAADAGRRSVELGGEGVDEDRAG